VTRVIVGTVIVALLSALPVAAQMMTGYSIDIETGVVTRFSCLEQGDSNCFRYRTEIGTIPTTFANGFSAVTSLAPAGELVVGYVGLGEPRLDWLDLPSLDVVATLPLVGDIQSVGDVAFGPDSGLWVIGLPESGYRNSLFSVDQATGEVIETWQYPRELTSIAFVGEQMFLMAGTQLLEFDPATGIEREIADYFWPNGYHQRVTGLTAHDGRLWSVSEFAGGYGSPPGTTTFSMGHHDPETGAYEMTVIDFGYGHNSHWGFTFDLIDIPEQPPPAIPAVGRRGVLVLLLAIGFAGVIFVRRICC